jgi:L-fuculokinase
MKESVVIVLDCGATNVRAVAVNNFGKVLSIHSMLNHTCPDPNFPGGLIWDVDEIFWKLVTCTRDVVNRINPETVKVITITTFGVNGAPVDKKGRLLYPVISWQCQRTVPVMENIDKYIHLHKLFAINGVNKFHFNTINTLIWLKENHKKVIEKMEAFLFIPSLFIHRLTGNMVNDTTMAGTSMLTDILNRNFSSEILEAVHIPAKFSILADPGTVAGHLLPAVASEMSLPAGIPVVLAGHDTQFALIGAGAQENEAILNSGTWEILMTRNQNVDLSIENLNAGVTNEFDAIPGMYNTGIQWLASGILEWIRYNFYGIESEKEPERVYDIMIREASETDIALEDIQVDINFMTSRGSISGLGLKTSRAEIYRAALNALSKKTRVSLELLQSAGKFKAKSLIISGGGSKNNLWNRMRTCELGIPLRIVKESETTVIGAALFAFKGINLFTSVEEGLKAFSIKYEHVDAQCG